MPAPPASNAAGSAASDSASAAREANADAAPPAGRDRRLPAAVLGTLALAAGLVAFTGGSPAAFITQLATGGWPVVLWLVAAWGGGRLLGRVLRDPAARPGPGDAATDLALGVALLLALDSAVLRLDAGATTVWGLTAAGLLAAAWDLRRGRGTAAPPLAETAPPVPGLLLLLASIPAAVLLAAASTAPGWLWSSEFGGYDALSYHLQLPAEWAEAGRSTPLTHNVYAFLPNAVEHAFLHVGRLAGDPRTAGTTAHFLHAAMAIGAAAATAGLAQTVRLRFGASRRAAQWSGGIAGILVLATPWTIVTGSLAYTEMAVLWMLAASMRLAVSATGRPGLRDGLAHGLLAGAATAAKLTAGPMAVLPAACWWLAVRRGGRGSPRVIGLVAAGGAAAGLAVLAPWLIAGAAWTGNPVFPFAADLLGAGHWNAEQVAAWRAGHGGGGGPMDLAREWLVHGVAGDEPPQWGVLPVAGLVMVLGLLAGTVGRFRAGDAEDARDLAVPLGLIAMLTTSVLAWAILTHAESRFLLPTAIPLALAIGLIPGVRGRRGRGGRRGGPARHDHLALRGLGLNLVAVQVIWSATLAMREQDGRLGLGVGAGPALRGDSWQQSMTDALAAGDAATRRELRALAPPTWWVRFGLGPDARVLMIGEAAVYHHPPSRISYRTVWDRDQLTAWLDAGEDAAGHPRPDDPGWAAAATAAGFTHAFIDRVLLTNWAERGWNDPRMTFQTLTARAGRELPVIASFDNGGRLLVRLGDG